MRTLLIVSALALMVASAALAGPRTGVAVPLPEALPPGTFDLQIDTRGSGMLQGMEAQQVLGAQVGLPYGFEVGIDVGVGSHQNAWNAPGVRDWELQYNPDLKGWDNLWINVKKQLLTEKALTPAVAIGLINIGSTPGASYWVTVGKHLAGFNLCLGASGVGRDTIWYEAISYQANPQWKFIAEHTGGGTMSTNFAIEHSFFKHWTSSIAWMKANDSLHDDAWFLRTTYTDSFLW